MRRFLPLLVVAIPWTAVQAFATLPQPRDNAAAERVLIDNERKLNEAVAKGDRATLLGLVAEPSSTPPDPASTTITAGGLWVSGGGFIPMNLFVDHLDFIKATNWTVENPKVLWVDSTTAIVGSVWMGTGTVANQPFVPKVSSTVWTKRGDKWVAVYHQESDLPKQ